MTEPQSLSEEVRILLRDNGPMTLDQLYESASLATEKAKLAAILSALKTTGWLRACGQDSNGRRLYELGPRSHELFGLKEGSKESRQPPRPPKGGGPAAGEPPDPGDDANEARPPWARNLAVVGQEGPERVIPVAPRQPAQRGNGGVDPIEAILRSGADSAQRSLDEYIRLVGDPTVLNALIEARDRALAVHNHYLGGGGPHSQR
jgi:hypothetical protein